MKKVSNQVQATSSANVVNSVVLTGYVGADAVIKNFGDQKLARVNLAVNEYHKNNQGEITKRTNWFNIALWNAHAELAEKEIKKGTRITVTGRLQTGSYEAKDGNKRYTTEIQVNELSIDANPLID